MSKLKVLMAPVNISGQPKMLTKGLIDMGVDARLFQYGQHKFGYESDIVVDIGSNNRTSVQLQSVKDMVEMEFDVFHFWFRTFYYGSYYDGFPGFDLLMLKSAGKKIVYRFTGYDLRLSSLEKEMNPWNAYQYGFQPLFDEVEQKKYLFYLAEFVDQFVVQDIEMESYMIAAGLPAPKIVPRTIDLEDWAYIGVEKTDRPLIIHAPSKSAVKGTDFVIQAVNELRAEGLVFDFKLIQNMPHDEARSWYQKCDIAVDQLLIGWYGVFSMECMALGKPVIVYIRDDLMEKSNKSEPIPIINANPSTIKGTLKHTIQDYEYRKDMSKKQRDYVERVHDVKVAAASIKSCYEDLVKKDFRPIDVAQAVPHIEHQMRKYTDTNSQTVFIRQRSGFSINQDHRLFNVLKKVNQRRRKIISRIKQKRDLIWQCFGME